MKQKLPLIIGFAIVFMATAACAQQPGETPPGQMIDIGGHKMHIKCEGPLNSPITVVFESGGGGSAKDWSRVQPLLKNVGTCAYDRAGSGWS